MSGRLHGMSGLRLHSRSPVNWSCIWGIFVEWLAILFHTTGILLAAVNFGQYDNSAYMPYKPAKINRHIPAAGSPEEAVTSLIVKNAAWMCKSLTGHYQTCRESYCSSEWLAHRMLLSWLLLVCKSESISCCRPWGIGLMKICWKHWVTRCQPFLSWLQSKFCLHMAQMRSTWTRRSTIISRYPHNHVCHLCVLV